MIGPLQGVLNHTTNKGAPLQKRDYDHAISRKDLESGPESLWAEKKTSDDICYEDLVPDGTRNSRSSPDQHGTGSNREDLHDFMHSGSPVPTHFRAHSGVCSLLTITINVSLVPILLL